VKRRPLVLIAGWAHTEHALHPVASALHAAAYDIKVKSIWQLLDQMEKATRQGCSPNACRPARVEDLARRGACKEKPGLSCYANALKQILEKQGAQCVVVGWSAGAIVGLEVACETPGSVRKEPRAVLGRFFQDVSWPAVESESCLNEKVNAACHIGIEHLVHGLEYLRKMDLRDRLKGIEIPILIIHGKKDRIVPWQAGAWLNRSLPNSRIIIHKGVGHDIPERQAVVLASQIREFLENRC